MQSIPNATEFLLHMFTQRWRKGKLLDLPLVDVRKRNSDVRLTKARSGRQNRERDNTKFGSTGFMKGPVTQTHPSQHTTITFNRNRYARPGPHSADNDRGVSFPTARVPTFAISSIRPRLSLDATHCDGLHDHFCVSCVLSFSNLRERLSALEQLGR